MPTNTIQNRNFGVELEIVGLDTTRAAEVIRDAGINCQAEGYNHANRVHWKTVTDGSIVNNRGRHYDDCCEVVSPILNGEEGLEALRKVCKALANAGATVNKTTGFHVHVDARNLNAREIAMVIKRYAKHEYIIDSMMPVSRRANNNYFCNSIIEIANNSNFNNVSNVDALISVFRGRFGNERSRYVKVNLESYLRHGSIEFRQHSGSINAEKVCNWVRFCVNFVEVSKRLAANVIANNNVPSAPRRRGRPANANRVNRNTRRPNGATRVRCILENALSNMHNANAYTSYVSVSELARLAQISEASIPATISTLRGQGLRIRNSRYSGYALVSLNQQAANTAPVVSPTVITVPLDDTCFVGLSESLVAYYNERIADLAA